MCVLCVFYVCTVQLWIYPKAFCSDLQYKCHVACVTHFGVFFVCSSPSTPNRGKAPNFLPFFYSEFFGPLGEKYCTIRKVIFFLITRWKYLTDDSGAIFDLYELNKQKCLFILGSSKAAFGLRHCFKTAACIALKKHNRTKLEKTNMLNVGETY